MPNNKQVEELLYQALETEIGGQQVYEMAIECAKNKQLKEEWQEYLDQTRNHEQIIRRTFETMGLDPNIETPGRQVVRHHGESLVKAMEMAKRSAPESAQIVAAECVVHAETKDHQNWTLMKELASQLKDKRGKALEEAVKEVEDEEDEHLYHTMGWTRELWIDSLGMQAVLPPPEEKKDVRTAIGAARAAAAREQMTGKKK